MRAFRSAAGDAGTAGQAGCQAAFVFAGNAPQPCRLGSVRALCYGPEGVEQHGAALADATGLGESGAMPTVALLTQHWQRANSLRVQSCLYTRLLLLLCANRVIAQN